MSTTSSDFFKHKSDWARIKDALLSCYLKPYAAKILHTGHPLLYADCFAGKGRFDDGEDGSPVIACKVLDECLSATVVQRPYIERLFIEKQHAADLKNNLSGYENVLVHSGLYGDLPQLLEAVYESGVNLFLYIDPFGIADLDMSFFDSIVNKFPSVEILLNLNTFGFFREACRVYGLEYDHYDEDGFIVEREPWAERNFQDSKRKLSIIAGGDYWQNIVCRYKDGVIEGYEVEKTFATQYCDRLMQSFNYVQHFPIRVKEGNRPKYRMIHATNHAEGAVLMYDIMFGRKETLLSDLQRDGQMSLFNENVENEIIDFHKLESRFRDHVLSYSVNTPDNEVLAQFVVREGVSCSLGDLRNVLREMELSGQIVLTRDPAHTKTGGVSKFMSSGSGKRLTIRKA